MTRNNLFKADPCSVKGKDAIRGYFCLEIILSLYVYKCIIEEHIVPPAAEPDSFNETPTTDKQTSASRLSLPPSLPSSREIPANNL